MTKSKMEKLPLVLPVTRSRGSARPLSDQHLAILELKPGEMLKFSPCYGEHKLNKKRMWCTAQVGTQTLRRRTRQHEALTGVRTWHLDGNFYVGRISNYERTDIPEEEVDHEIDRLIDGDYDEDTLKLMDRQGSPEDTSL